MANPPALYGVGEGTSNLKKFTDQIEGSLEGRMATLEVGAASELDPPCPRALFYSFSGPGGRFASFLGTPACMSGWMDHPKGIMPNWWGSRPTCTQDGHSFRVFRSRGPCTASRWRATPTTRWGECRGRASCASSWGSEYPQPWAGGAARARSRAPSTQSCSLSNKRASRGFVRGRGGGRCGTPRRQ